MTLGPFVTWACGLLGLLTGALIAMKLVGWITWAWWLVLLPAAPVVFFALVVAYAVWVGRL